MSKPAKPTLTFIASIPFSVTNGLELPAVKREGRIEIKTERSALVAEVKRFGGTVKDADPVYSGGGGGLTDYDSQHIINLPVDQVIPFLQCEEIKRLSGEDVGVCFVSRAEDGILFCHHGDNTEEEQLGIFEEFLADAGHPGYQHLKAGIEARKRAEALAYDVIEHARKIIASPSPATERLEELKEFLGWD